MRETAQHQRSEAGETILGNAYSQFTPKVSELIGCSAVLEQELSLDGPSCGMAHG
jgi:hypothetical protein|tara:strand:- start:34 stop:198 length:165 start_codon:yes stop_codon:yes gene_type:complete